MNENQNTTNSNQEKEWADSNAKSIEYMQDCLTLGGTLQLNDHPILENELENYADKRGI